MEQRKITVEALVAAGINKVWKYYTRPEHITQWNFAAADWLCPKADNDLRVGGKYNARMEARDGSVGFDFEAVYTEVQEHKKLSFTMGDGREVTTTFEEEDGGTKVTTTFDAESEHDPEMQRGGWQAIVDNFKKYTEEN